MDHMPSPSTMGRAGLGRAAVGVTGVWVRSGEETSTTRRLTARRKGSLTSSERLRFPPAAGEGCHNDLALSAEQAFE